jgi:signal transduction histidine kinase
MDSPESRPLAEDHLQARISHLEGELTTLRNCLADRNGLAPETLCHRSGPLPDAIQRLAGLGYWEFDLLTGRSVWSDERYRLLGWQPGEVTPSFKTFLTRVHPDDRQRVVAARQQALATPEPFRCEYRVVLPGGQLSWRCSRGQGEADGSGRVVRLVGFTLDIDQRKRAEEEAEQLEAQMQEAQKLESLGVLAGGIAHNFNNLLTTILGFADLVGLEMPPASPAQAYLVQIEQAARRAAGLCQQMLAYAGKGRMFVEPLDLSALVRGMDDLLSAAMARRGVLSVELAGDLPWVEGDAAQMRQLVMNLVANAAEALEERPGGRLVTLRTGVLRPDREFLATTIYHSEPGEGLHVWLEVQDDGCGMTPEVLARAFEPFFSTKFTGRGLGLAAVLGIVGAHHGALRVQTEPGRGSSFRVLFPALPDDRMTR